MRTSQFLFIATLFVTSLLVANGSDVQIASQEGIERKTYAEDPDEPVHPPPKNPSHSSSGTSSSTSASSGNSGSSSTNGGNSENSSNSESSSNSANSNNSGSGTNSGNGGDGQRSGGGSGGVGSLNQVQEGPAHKGTMLMLGVAAVAGVAIAVATIPKRRVETQAHPLKGSLNRRINLFSNFAKHTSDPTARPPRRAEDGAYVNADEAMV